jgi:hypothetical protein
MSDSEAIEKVLEETRPSALSDLFAAMSSIKMAHRYATTDVDYTKSQLEIAYRLLGGRDSL